MVLLEIHQGYGHDSECSSERRVVISGHGWRAQCRERHEREKEREDMAAPECEREARKRRERRDSGCAHERKERRPHSEERTPPPPPPPPLHDHNRLESERRAERLSRARRPQLGGKRRRGPARLPRQPKENDYHDHGHEDIRIATPPFFDYVVQQKPELCEESQPSMEAIASERHEEAEYTRRDERSEPPRRAQPSPDRRLEKISKKITVLKKNIAKYESEFEVKHGYSITQGERMTNVQLTRMYETLRQLQLEKKCIKADPVEYALKLQAAKQQKERDDKLNVALKSDKPMADVVVDIEEWVEGCRQAEGRASVPETNWTPAQLAAEKACVQRALLRLEAARGRPPAHSAERGAARHLYERYRAVKRALATHRPDSIIGGTNGELATIHEHETMLFNTSVDSSSDSQDKPSDTSQENEDALQSPPIRDGEELPSSTSSAPSATSEEAPNEGLHCLGLEELGRALAEAKMQKCILRRCIKDYEVNFEQQNSRKVQRDDKKSKEEEYQKYKTIKARIKLLNALINKQKTSA
ncbi:protein FAM13A isoform X1 [Danaus plexippus]|uniref:protein FAM13A isoform X1 n=2 Tax=Danaus plexippus TaxID=13037 RepID=UPI002AB10C33|nr:protein FAM13A isoform X1 [Danaus plexippus]XP_032511068.2 protein FAM13A isoform X1 [Danaus plexippus]XP_061377753.1 protein FAM13A isoform X1 [Danaus plexippus]